MKLIHKLLLTAPLLGLAACATPQPKDFNTIAIGTPLGDHAPVAIVDTRTTTQRTTRSEPLGGVSALYLGDDKFSPGPVSLLASRLGRHASELGSAETITLKEFEVRVVDPGAKAVDSNQLMTAAASAGPMGLVAAPLAGALISAIEFGRREITTRSVVEIGVGARRFRGVAYKSFGSVVTEADIAKTIDAALADLEVNLAKGEASTE